MAHKKIWLISGGVFFIALAVALAFALKPSVCASPDEPVAAVTTPAVNQAEQIPPEIVSEKVEARPDFPRQKLAIQQKNGRNLYFDVEVATTPEEQTYGLMFKSDLLSGTGMLFLFPQEQEASFWMKDTFIPLDMLFIRGDGTIAKIIASAKPQDINTIKSGEPVRAVLEIGGGESKRLKIKTGDIVLGIGNQAVTP